MLEPNRDTLRESRGANCFLFDANKFLTHVDPGSWQILPLLFEGHTIENCSP